MTEEATVDIFPCPDQKGHWVIEAKQWLPCPLDEVFPFFADAFNLSQLTPPWLKFNVLTPAPIEMHTGALLDYRLKLRGIPIKWRTEIEEWKPPYQFVDTQLKGPYKRWHHLHSFKEVNGGTVVEDRVVYRPLGGWLVNKLLVERDLKRVFAYRQDILEKRFAKKVAS